MEEYTIGVDVGGTKIAYGLFDGARHLVARHQEPSDPTLSPEVFLDDIALVCRKMLDDHQLGRDQVRGVGIGVPSYVLYEEGTIIKTANLPRLRDVRARAHLVKSLGGDIRVLLDNDAHTAALAEHRHGAGRGFHHMLYCAISTGISTGLIINGQLFRGRYGWAGESGHMIVTPGEGIECGCGNVGCLMSYCSGSMIVRHIRHRIDRGEPTAMVAIAGGPERITVGTVAIAYDQGDPMARWAIAQMAKYLAIWLYNLYVMLNINCFVFGGGMVRLGDRLFPQVRQLFDKYNDNDLPVYFKKAELDDDFGIVGAAELLFP